MPNLGLNLGLGVGGGALLPAALNEALQDLQFGVDTDGLTLLDNKDGANADEPVLRNVNALALNGTNQFVGLEIPHTTGTSDFRISVTAWKTTGPTVTAVLFEGRDFDNDGLNILWSGSTQTLRASLNAVDLVYAVDFFADNNNHKMEIERVGNVFNLYVDDLVTPVITGDVTGQSVTADIRTSRLGTDFNSSLDLPGGISAYSYTLAGVLQQQLTFSDPLLGYIPDVSGNYNDATEEGSPTWTTRDDIGSYDHSMGFTTFTDDTIVELMPYYDNRVSAFVTTIDGYKDGNITTFEEAITRAVENDIVTTVGSFSDPAFFTNQATLDMIQGYLDSGDVKISSYSFDDFNWSTITDDDLPLILSMVQDSKALIPLMWDLPLSNSYKGAEIITSWIQSYGTANDDYQATIDTYLQSVDYLTDASVTGASRQYVNWDSDISQMYDRTAREDGDVVLATNTARFDTIKAAGGIYLIYTHPVTDDYGVGSELDQFFQYAGGRTDMWYVGLDDLYLYRHLLAKATPSLTITEGAGLIEVEVSASATERAKYGLSYPLTYKVTVPGSATAATVSYKEDGGSYALMTEKLISEVFNGIDAYRTDFANDCIYVSQSLPQTKDIMHLKVEYS